jgi:hypothetical protein
VTTLLVGAVEILDDRRFLLGQPDLRALVIKQQLLARLEGIGADGEGGILALFVLAQLRTDAGQQHGKT